MIKLVCSFGAVGMNLNYPRSVITHPLKSREPCNETWLPNITETAPRQLYWLDPPLELTTLQVLSIRLQRVLN